MQQVDSPCGAMTVDVEDYFQVAAFTRQIARHEWERFDCRVERNLDVILAMLAEHQVKATFFTLGWIAERHPFAVRRIVEQGHELASHGYEHIKVNTQDPKHFREDIRRTKTILEDLGGQPVRGY